MKQLKELPENRDQKILKDEIIQFCSDNAEATRQDVWEN